MKNNIFRQIGLQMQQKAPRITEPWEVILSHTKTGATIQKGLHNGSCRIRQITGGCIGCDYGCGIYFSKEEIWNGFVRITKECREIFQDNAPKNTILDSSGSILDEKELDQDLLMQILEYEFSYGFTQRITIETHPFTITEAILNRIYQLVKKFQKKGIHKEIIFEIGLESSNTEIRNQCLNKFLNNDYIIKIAQLIEKYNFHLEVNLIYGVPLLTKRENQEHILKSIEWVDRELGVNVDVVIFPMNIKKYTILNVLYQQNLYKVPEMWGLIEVLNHIPDKLLEKVYFAWYGEKASDHPINGYIMPKDCILCHDKLISALDFIYSQREVALRRKALKDLGNSVECECRQDFLKEMKKEEKWEIIPLQERRAKVEHILERCWKKYN